MPINRYSPANPRHISLLLLGLLFLSRGEFAEAQTLRETRLYDACNTNLSCGGSNLTCDTIYGCVNWSTSFTQNFQCSFETIPSFFYPDLVNKAEVWVEGSGAGTGAIFCAVSTGNTSASCGPTVVWYSNWYIWLTPPKPPGSFDASYAVQLFVTLPPKQANGDVAKFKTFRVWMN